jgi:hypothetical protein
LLPSVQKDPAQLHQLPELRKNWRNSCKIFFKKVFFNEAVAFSCFPFLDYFGGSMLNHKCEKFKAGATRTGTTIQQFTNARRAFAPVAQSSFLCCLCYLLLKKCSAHFAVGRCCCFALAVMVLPLRLTPFVAVQWVRRAYKNDNQTQSQNRTYES